MKFAQLIEFAHPISRCRQIALPDRANALFIWQKAGRNLVGRREIQGYFDLAFPCDCQKEECAHCNDPEFIVPPYEIATILRRNARALRLLSTGLLLGELQIPLDSEKAIRGLDDLYVLHRLIFLKAVSQVAISEFHAAALTVADSLEMARMYFLGEGGSIHLLIAMALHREALGAARWLADQDGIDADSLYELRLAIDRVPLDEALICCTRGDFYHADLRCIERIPDGLPCDETVSIFLERYCGLTPHGSVDGSVDDTKAYRFKAVRFLLRQHPCVWNPAATVRGISMCVADSIAQLSTPPADLLLITPEAAAWRMQAAKLQELLPRGVWPSDGNSEEPPILNFASEDDFALLREKIATIANPLGLLLGTGIPGPKNMISDRLEEVEDLLATIDSRQRR